MALYVTEQNNRASSYLYHNKRNLKRHKMRRSLIVTVVRPRAGDFQYLEELLHDCLRGAPHRPVRWAAQEETHVDGYVAHR